MSRVERILSIDPATKCGWAVFEGTDRIASGVQDFSTKKGTHPGERFHNSFIFFETKFKEYWPDHIVYEAVKRWSSSQAALIYGGLTSMMQLVAHIGNTPVHGIAPTQAKKHCTGNGRASKEEMIEWANKQFSLIVKDDNEADALAVGYTYLHAGTNIQEPPGIILGTPEPTKTKRSRKGISTTGS